MKLLYTKLQLRNDQNRGYETAKEKVRVRNNRNYGYEMTENYGYETARVRNDWLPFSIGVKALLIHGTL